MTAAIIGLLGAALGAATALVGSALSDRRQARQEAARWQRDQRMAAYEGALRYLLRSANRRSEILAEGVAFIATEHQREWFDDLVEAQFWLRTLTTRCETAQAVHLRGFADKLDDAIARTAGQAAAPSGGALTFEDVRARDRPVRELLLEVLPEAIQAVSECARLYHLEHPGLRVPRARDSHDVDLPATVDGDGR